MLKTRTYAIVNQKGGVGKTTTTNSLGTALARFHGKKVLLVDLDAQANLTDGLGVDPREARANILEFLTGEVPAQEIILQIPGAELFLIPSSLTFAKADLIIASKMNRERLLSKAVRTLSNFEFDIILLDCPPSLGLVTLNALAAAQGVVVPLEAEYYGLTALENIACTLTDVRDEIEHDVQLSGILLTNFDKRKTLSRDVAKEVDKGFPKMLYETRIRNNVAVAEAPSHYKCIYDYKPDSTGSFDYKQFAAEFAKREGI